MNIWEGTFNSFKDAKKKSKGKGFKGKKWSYSQNLLFQECLKNFNKKKKRIPKKYIYRYQDFLTIIKKLFKNTKEIRVLDFGGGFGIGYFYLKKNSIKLFNYTIVENKTMVENFKNKNRNIKYISKFNYDVKYDIVNCCSVIQYIEKWKLLINKLSNIKSNYIFFSDMFIGEVKTFVTLQNYYGDKIPHWFLNFEEFDYELRKRGFTLIKKSKMITKRLQKNIILPMNNFDKKHTLSFTLNLLYKRN